MDTLRIQTDKSSSKLLWIVPYIIVLVGLFFSFAGLSEFYNVAIHRETGVYPWGHVNEVPWYYQTPAIYSAYNLTSGLLFLSVTVLTFWATVKKSKKLVIAGVSLTILFLLADFVSASIQ